MLTGPPAVWHDMVVAGKEGTTRAELIALSLTGILLLIAFGTLTAAAVPLLVGYAGVIVVAVAILAALTLVPALLAWLGPRIDSLRVFGRRRRPDAPPARFWSRWARAVMRRPTLSILAVATILLTLAAPPPP